MRIEDLCVTFDDKVIFDHANFIIGEESEAKHKSVTCISGPSGVGKTTLLRVIAGLLVPKTGRIIGNGNRPAFMFQEDRLLPWLTAKDNIVAVMTDSVYGKKSVKEKNDLAMEWLERVELGKEGNSFPGELSGGMQRRVSLARTLAYGGDIILMDEPLKGLDQPLVERLVPVILRETVPVLISTHSQYEMELLGGNVLEI